MDSTLDEPHNGASGDDAIPKRTPLPKMALFIVMLIQFAEPVTGTVIYPFINQFVHETGITGGDEKRTGYYAGIIESVFFFAEALTVFHWGWVSDRIGRRPVLLLGPFGLSIAMIGFGLSRTFWPLVVYRCFQGIFNGNIGVSKVVVFEITDETNLADAYALGPLMWGLGSTLGPIIGGFFARPAIRWRDSFGRVAFFHDHPYFLSCAVAGLVAFLSFALAFVGLKETLPSKKRKESKTAVLETSSLLSGADTTHYGSNGSGDATENSISPSSDVAMVNDRPMKASDRQPPPFRTLLIPQVLMPFTSVLFLTFIDMSFQVLRPLVYSTSIPLGGLGFTPYDIGMILGIWGFLNAIIQTRIFGPLARRYGPRKMYIFGMSTFPIVFALYPLLSYLVQREGRVNAKVWAVLLIQLTLNMSSYIAYGGAQLMVVNSAPTRIALGSVNGLSQAGGCAARALAPTIASSLFSVSLERNLAGGNLVFLIMVGISCGALYFSSFLPKRPHSRTA